MSVFLLLLLAQQGASVAAQQRSVGLQMVAVRKQARLPVRETPAFFVMESAEAESAKPATCDALAPMRVGKLVEDAARRTGVSAGLIQEVMRQESAFRPCAVSEKGALGLMQLMPATADQFGVTDPFNPEENVSAGADLLKQLISRYSGDLNRVLGAYNAGSARVDAINGVPMIPETMNYVERILGRIN